MSLTEFKPPQTIQTISDRAGNILPGSYYYLRGAARVCAHRGQAPVVSTAVSSTTEDDFDLEVKISHLRMISRWT
jgi:hypothetical protein